MPPKTRLAEMKENEGAPEKNDSPARKKKRATEKKKTDAVKRKQTAARKMRESVKKKREAAKANAAEKKRKRDSGVDGESSSNPTKRARNRVGETTSSPPVHQGDRSPAPSGESASQADNEGTPSPTLQSLAQKSTTETPIEAENPLQPPVTSLSVSGSSTKSHSHRVDNEDEKIGSNNRDSHPAEAAINNDAQRMVAEENMAVEPMRPVGFFFKPSEYDRVCKLSTRCHQYDFLKTIDKFEVSEKSWFENHPQFKHIFHMDCCNKNKVMALWMLLLRSIHTEKGRQAWFGVNGVPIRYSIREHGLLCGLDCRTYPENYPSIGPITFATKHFKHLQKKRYGKKKKKGKGKKQGLRVTEMDVIEKLEKMQPDDNNERLKMAVLYFLATVIRGRSKHGYFIEPFILSAVDSLDFCVTFPWGCYTFDDSMKEIFHLRDHFANGLPEKVRWTFPGFINPLEILAFECIPALRERFRDPVPNCLSNCPRMCK